MTEETKAALDPIDAFVQGADDQGTEQTTQEAQTTESAPVEDATETTKPNEEGGVQKRINKITADKHEEIRKRQAEAKRADDLQKRLDEIESNKPKLEKPTLEQHEYDEEAFNKASVNYEVQEQVKAELAKQKAEQGQINQQAEREKVQVTFNERAEALGKDDYLEKANAVPVLPDGVAAAKISAKMSVKPEIKTSAAPDPIEPVSAGSALQSEIGDEMSMNDWMAKYG